MRWIGVLFVLAGCTPRATTGTYCYDHDEKVCAIFDFDALEIRPTPGSPAQRRDTLTRVDARTFTINSEERAILRVKSADKITIEMGAKSGTLVRR